MFRLTDTAIDLAALEAAVRRPENGGMVIFVGTVRSPSHGRTVRYLDYEAYRGMAEREMERIAEKVCEKWGVRQLAIVHRVGRVEVGESAVAVAAASPHRRQAFEACQYAMDRVKEAVPIWKKEHCTDGERWSLGNVSSPE
ncbi:MAG TPA: molybdenum cofactor biosynthesis protein MoaE [Acidobacteriota bacterium]|jgi:molybdopterin synthase catalytic subunit